MGHSIASLYNTASILLPSTVLPGMVLSPDEVEEGCEFVLDTVFARKRAALGLLMVGMADVNDCEDSEVYDWEREREAIGTVRVLRFVLEALGVSLASGVSLEGMGASASGMGRPFTAAIS